MSGSFYHFPSEARADEAEAERSILCVQPNAAHSRFLQHALECYRVVTAANALDAIRLKNQTVFDAYVLDYWLPDWSGVALCRDIRKNDPHVPILFYTSAASDYAKRAFRAGAMAFIEAPADAGALRQRMRQLIAASDKHDQLARVEEERVIHEELQRRAAIARQRTEQAMQQAASAIARAAQVKASRAFIDAGGTRAGFDRLWPRDFAAARTRDEPA